MNEIIKFENGQLIQPAIELIKFKEREMKKLKEEYDQLKADLLKAMEQNEVLKFENDEISINYIEAREDERFDSKLLKETSPDLYDQFVKFTPVKASIRIKVK